MLQAIKNWMVVNELGLLLQAIWHWLVRKPHPLTLHSVCSPGCWYRTPLSLLPHPSLLSPHPRPPSSLSHTSTLHPPAEHGWNTRKVRSLYFMKYVYPLSTAHDQVLSSQTFTLHGGIVQDWNGNIQYFNCSASQEKDIQCTCNDFTDYIACWFMHSTI